MSFLQEYIFCLPECFIPVNVDVRYFCIKTIADSRRNATKRPNEHYASMGEQPESSFADLQESDPDEDVAPSTSGPFSYY